MAAEINDGREEAIGRVLDDLRRVFQIVHGYSKRAERTGGLTGPQLCAGILLGNPGLLGLPAFKGIASDPYAQREGRRAAG